ncbi:universal stress protein [Variovorax sp. J22R133]|uniref:universal stress protein n=1 Tax=Variovorax brevis TaxID=3053503 RepID=UPI002578F14D|nr:universal stress protein [Variovorax sp. J22R133]MDM0110974.1 universal stress protein [Variovorax sp. J22R133]
MFKRILVATDGSSLSEQAVSKAIDLSLLCGAELRAMTVAHLAAHSFFDGSSVLSQVQSEEAQARSVEKAQALVDAVKAAALAKGVGNVEAVVVKTNLVAESIIEFAQTHDCDLIVMASHGRRGLTRMLMGSETLHVLTHSHIPVLVLR